MQIQVCLVWEYLELQACQAGQLVKLLEVMEIHMILVNNQV